MCSTRATKCSAGIQTLANIRYFTKSPVPANIDYGMYLHRNEITNTVTGDVLPYNSIIPGQEIGFFGLFSAQAAQHLR